MQLGVCALRLLILRGDDPDRALRRRRWCDQQLVHLIDQLDSMSSGGGDLALRRLHFVGQRLIAGQDAAQFHKRAHHLRTQSRGTRAALHN